ncbi:hypothetical protein Tco_0109848 [Tanacetum coccineum]
MDDPNITMEEYIRLEEEKAHRRGKVYKWETAMYGKIWCNEDVHDLRSVETEFPAIVFDNAFTSEVTHSCEPTLEIFTLQMGMYNSSQSSCDFTTVAINGESEERRTIEGIIRNYYDLEDDETALRFELPCWSGTSGERFKNDQP